MKKYSHDKLPPKKGILRLVVLALIIVGGLSLAYFSPVGEWLDQDRIKDASDVIRGTWWAPIVLILLYIVFGFTGIPPAPLFVGGAIFGAVWGTIYNVVGLTLSAASGFFLAHYLGKDFVVHYAKGKYLRIRRFFKRFGFWPLVQARFLPIPGTLLNIGSALSGVPASTYILASFVGIFPSALIHTVSISNLIYSEGTGAKLTIGIYYIGAFAVVNLVIGGPWLMSQWKRRVKYKKIMQERAARVCD